MKFFFTTLTLIIAFAGNSQNNFEKGYFIDNKGVKTDCFIKNIDWKNNPTSFNFKLDENSSDINSKSIANVKEFAIQDKSKFTRETVAIDQSSQNYYGLTISPNPVFKEETVFLKVLVEGESNLYYYENEYFGRYFFSKNNKIEQLIYKEYKGQDGNTYYNDRFKQQLFLDFICKPEDKSKILKLKYDDNLVDYFIETNNCKSGNTATKEISKKRAFEINFKPNLLVNNMVTKSDNLDQAFVNTTDKNSKIGFGFGFEIESVLPYNNKNWSIVFDPSFASTTDSFTMVYKPGYIYSNYNVDIKTSVFRLPLGMRRYFYLNENSKLFLNASVSVNLGISKLKVDDSTYSDGGLTLNFPIGFGYQFRKYTIELKYYGKTLTSIRKISNDNFYYINQLSLKLGYQLF